MYWMLWGLFHRLWCSILTSSLASTWGNKRFSYTLKGLIWHIKARTTSKLLWCWVWGNMRLHWTPKEFTQQTKVMHERNSRMLSGPAASPGTSHWSAKVLRMGQRQLIQGFTLRKVAATLQTQGCSPERCYVTIVKHWQSEKVNSKQRWLRYAEPWRANYST